MNKISKQDKRNIIEQAGLQLIPRETQKAMIKRAQEILDARNEIRERMGTVRMIDDQEFFDVAGGGDVVDIATSSIETEQSAEVNRINLARIAELNASIKRLQQGVNEAIKCTCCGEEIATERLEVLPFARQCFDCQTAQEGGTRRLFTVAEPYDPPKEHRFINPSKGKKPKGKPTKPR